MKKSLDKLRSIQKDILDSFPGLSSELVEPVNNIRYLHFWKYSNQGLDYLPNFHLIVEITDNKNICAKILSYQGRDLATIIIGEDNELSQLDEFVQNYTEAKLCEGVICGEETLELTDFFNKNIAKRSVKCSLQLSNDDKHCQECKTILVKVKTEAEEPSDLEEKCNDEWLPLKTECIFPSDDGAGEAEDYFEEPKPKKKRGRPAAKSKDLKKKQRNQTPKMRSIAEEMEKQTDEASGFNQSCQVCLKSCKSRITFKDHMDRHHKYFSTAGLVSCPLCQNECEKLELTRHFKDNHDSQTCCLICLEVMPVKWKNQQSTLSNHIRSKHQIRPVCQLCQKVVSDVYRLDIHMKTVHNSNVKDVFCHRCGKGFAHRILLQKHLRVTCGIGETWRCSLCPKTFDTKKKLKYHLKVHCTEKPFICPLCNYSCYKMENMLLHSRKVHHLKGCTDDFFVREEALKRQSEFVDLYLLQGDPKNHPKTK